MKTWKLQRMTHHTIYEATAEEFLMCFAPQWLIAHNLDEEQRLHMQYLVTFDMLNMLCKATTDVSELSKPLTVSDMSFQVKSIYWIMLNILAPKKGPHRAPEGVIRNLLVAIMGYRKFEAEDFFLWTFLHAAQEPLIHKPYAPWLMVFPNKKTQGKFCATTVHESYLWMLKHLLLHHLPLLQMQMTVASQFP